MLYILFLLNFASGRDTEWHERETDRDKSGENEMEDTMIFSFLLSCLSGMQRLLRSKANNLHVLQRNQLAIDYRI